MEPFRPPRRESGGRLVATWTKKLNADFRDLNNTLQTGADSLADYALRVGRLYVVAQRIKRHATEAEKELQDENATSANSLLAKRRSLDPSLSLLLDALARARNGTCCCSARRPLASGA